MEILRCRAVAPDWQDTSAASSGPYWDRHHALTLNVPQLLLQLPPTDPAKHPSQAPCGGARALTLHQLASQSQHRMMQKRTQRTRAAPLTSQDV